MSEQVPTLADYLTQTRRLLKDPNGQIYSTSDITDYINEGRNQLALDAECVRFNFQFDDTQKFAITGGTATAGNTTITGLANTTNVAVGQLLSGQSFIPATAQVVSFTSNTVTMTLAALANGGPASINFTPQFSTIFKQEQYPFPTAVLPSSGYQRVIQVKSVRVNWGGTFGSNLVTLQNVSFSRYAGFLRLYGINLVNQPSVWCGYEDTVLIRPLPSAPYPMEWDTICTPIPLATNTDPEAIKYPFTDAVKYFAAHLAFFNAQRAEDAERMFKQYERYTKRGRTFRQRTIIPNIYG